MQTHEFVETSDSEELEILNAQATAKNNQFASEPDVETPRKRRKLEHETESSYSFASIAQLSTPKRGILGSEADLTTSPAQYLPTREDDDPLNLFNVASFQYQFETQNNTTLVNNVRPDESRQVVEDTATEPPLTSSIPSTPIRKHIPTITESPSSSSKSTIDLTPRLGSLELDINMAQDVDSIDEGGLSTTRYSFRRREPRQINPYLFDKYMYKNQLRNIPDAIVKVTSPHKQHTDTQHVSHGPEADGDFVVPDDDAEESQIHAQDPPADTHDSGGKPSSVWLPGLSDLEDDELTALSIPDSESKKTSLSQKKSRSKLKRFPLTEAMLRRRGLGVRRDDDNDTSNGPMITYTRKRRLRNEEKDRSNETLLHSSPHSSPTPEKDVVSAIELSESESENSPAEGGDTPTRLSKRDKMSLKALRRMMPAVMARKILQSQNKNTSMLPTSESSKSGSDTEGEEEPLAPGRSRIIKRSTNASKLAEVLGDSESSESDHSVSLSPSLTSSSSSESDTDMGDHSNNGFFDDSFSGLNRRPRKRNEQLIDRMLSRTRTSGQGRTKRSRKKPVLEIRIPFVDTHQRTSNTQPGQTRLNFQRITNHSDHNHSEDNIIDLSTIDSPLLDESTERNSSAISKRLSKKERREKVHRSSLLTLSGGNKKITTGRKRGTLNVQIDLVDNGFREALRPSKRDSPLQTDRYQQTKGQSARTFNSNRGGEVLKQTSLLDFANGNSSLAHDSFDDYHRNVDPTPASIWHNDENAMRLNVDLGVPTPAIGLKLGPGTCIGQQRLYDLLLYLLEPSEIPPPQPYAGFGAIDLEPGLSPSKISESLELVGNLLSQWLEESTESLDEDDVRRYELLMYHTCQFSVWAYQKGSLEEQLVLLQSIDHCSSILLVKLNEYLSSSIPHIDTRYFSVSWFIIELTSRMLCASRRSKIKFDPRTWRETTKLLIRSLIRHNIKNAMDEITYKELNTQTVELRAAEAWICLVHLLPKMSVTTDDFRIQTKNGFWILLIEVIKEEGRHTDDVRSSEDLWRLAFSLSSLSHFSVHGVCMAKPHLTSCWEFVGIALDAIRLSYDAEKDKNIPHHSLKKRDRYLRMVVARCFLLGMEWQWSMQDAFAMFGKLVNIFRSRLFGNLIGESSDFPAFLRFSDLTLLEELRRTDSAFSVYLKLVVRSGRDESDGVITDREKMRMRKLVSLTVPISGVSFSKSKPPTNDELSMLINRFSSVIVAILLDPAIDSSRQLLNQARQYLDFNKADEASRRICIRALMYTAILFNHLSLPLEAPLQWLESITNLLLNEYRNLSKAIHAKDTDPRKVGDYRKERDDLTTTIQLLLGSVRYIIMKPFMNDNNSQKNLSDCPLYPHTGLLSGAWVRELFKLKELTDLPSSRTQVIQLVEEFLIARAKVLPPPRRTYVPVEQSNSESQDLFDEFDLDEAALAGLILGDENADVDKNRQKDKKIAEIMNRDVLPNIYRMLLQSIGSPSASSTNIDELERFWEETDTWIDCWVGCAAIVVKNGLRPWNHYLSLGPQSWDAIIYPFLRRRVSARFMYRMLLCDPNAYEEYSDVFITVCMQSLVTFNVTIENKFVSLMLSIDGLRHPLLRNLAVERAPERRDFELDRSRFVELRGEILRGIIDNFDSCLHQAETSKIEGDISKSKRYTEYLVTMFSAMRDIYKTLSTEQEQNRYKELCSIVFLYVKQKDLICKVARLHDFLLWGFNLLDIEANL